jgi:hypothetical protein
MLFSAEPARKYFTGRSVSVRRCVADAGHVMIETSFKFWFIIFREI